MKENRLTLTLCSQLGSKKWALPFALPFHFDHDSLPIFKRCDIWKTQSHFGLLSSLEGGYREITGPTLPTCSTSHPLAARNDGDQKIGVLLSQSARRTVTMGSPYLVIISRFLTLRRCFGLLLRKMRGARGHRGFFCFVFFDERQEEREKEKKGWKCDWNALPPTELYLSNGPSSGDKLILEIRGHFLCLFTCSQHTVISLKHTHKSWPSCTLRELMWRRVEPFWSSLWQQASNCWLCVCVCERETEYSMFVGAGFPNSSGPDDPLNFEPNKPASLSLSVRL